MVDVHPDALGRVFRALADPTRRAMLRSLAERERSVGELADPFRMSLAAASKHVKTLEQAGLVRRTVRGRTHVCRLDARPLREAREWIAFYEQFWGERLDVLETLLREEQVEAGKPRKPTGRRAPAAKKGRAR